MASSQEKEVRAQAEARQAASDRAWTKPDPEERPGVIGSVIKAVQGAKEAVVGKSHDEDADYYAEDVGGGDRDRSREDTAEKARESGERAREAKERAKERTGEMTEKAKEAAGETKDYTSEKAREAAERTKETAESAKEKTKETAESAKEKAKETAESAQEKAKETAESAREKTKEMGQSATDKTKETAQEAKEQTKETAQSAADKTKETTQSAASKLGELKDRAMGFFSGKKEEAKEQTYETAEEKLRETEEETRRRMEELRLKGRDEYEGDVARRVREDKDESERRGGGILGALGALKEKLTLHPSGTEVVEEKVVEDVSPGPVESALRASDQASGQTFNDVGRTNDEGVGVVRLDRHVKK